MIAIANRGYPKLLWPAIISVMLLVGCTNSRFIVRPLYNNLDNRMLSQFNRLAEFDEAQQAIFEKQVGTFHVWHRQSELPEYARLLRDVATTIGQNVTTPDQVNDWMNRAEIHSQAVRRCHPINFSIPLIRTLSVQQLASIEQEFHEEQAENRERYESRTPQQRVQRRLDKMETWAGRLNLKFTDEQSRILQSAFERQVSLRGEYYQLSALWRTELFALARQPVSEIRDDQLQEHIASFWTLLESNYPEQWLANRNMWKAVAIEFEPTLTKNQRQVFGRWMSKMADTLETIGKDEPSFRSADDPAAGCLVDAARSGAQQKPG
ncbi:MAG: DUF6279 family lipoprotein [Granulosicoccus sp.]